eukprot:g4302.t1
MKRPKETGVRKRAKIQKTSTVFFFFVGKSIPRKRKSPCLQTKIPFKKQRVREPRPLLELPEDSWGTVVPFLELYDVCALSLVCRSSRAACLSPSNYERFGPACWGWEELVKLMISDSSKMRFSKLSVAQLYLLPEQWCELLENAESTSLKDVAIAIATKLHNVVHRGSSGANHLQSLGSKQFDSLRVLSLQGCNGGRALWEALAISCPNLQDLRITENHQQSDTTRIGDDVLAAVSRFPSLVISA